MFISDLVQYVGTNTLIRVSVTNLHLEEDLFLLSSHLYAFKNHEEVCTKDAIKQIKSILRSFYNSIDDKFTELYLNLSDSYLPQYFTKLSDKYKGFKILEFSDYTIPLELLMSYLLKDKVLLIKTHETSRSLKFQTLFEKLGIKNKLDRITNHAYYVVSKDFYYDKKVEDLGVEVDETYDYETLDDIAYKTYLK